MNGKMKKMVSMLAVGAMAVSAFAGVGTTEVKAASKEKIGVLVADVSGEEAQGFRSYYENYIAENYDVEFSYTDALQSAEDEKTAIEKFASQGCQGYIMPLLPAYWMKHSMRPIKITNILSVR